MGDIGLKTARLAEAFGMDIIYWGRRPKNLAYPFYSLDNLLAKADVISIHLPLNDQTHQLLGASAFHKMKPHALVINTGRGGVIHQEALTVALQEGSIRGFAADVLAVQPPRGDDPLLALPNVIITPHVSSLTKRTYDQMCLLTVHHVMKVLSGGEVEMRYVVNS